MKIKIQIEYSIDGVMPDDVDVFNEIIKHIPGNLMSEDIDGTDNYAIVLDSFEVIE